MTNRRDLIKKLFQGIGITLLPVKLFASKDTTVKVETIKVETLEHVPTIHYRTRWTFNTVEEAEEFVRSLIPELMLLEVEQSHNPLYISGVKSGYRGAVKAQFLDNIKRMQIKIVHEKTGECVLADTETSQNRFPFWDISTAWAFLSNIRVNGRPVARDVKNGRPIFNQYLSQPIRKGNPSIVYLTDRIKNKV